VENQCIVIQGNRPSENVEVVGNTLEEEPLENWIQLAQEEVK
jgi:hypothetical protein